MEAGFSVWCVPKLYREDQLVVSSWLVGQSVSQFTSSCLFVAVLDSLGGGGGSCDAVASQQGPGPRNRRVPGSEEEDREGVRSAVVICEVCGLVRAL
jgi:hypothetical protein